jgi:hypothetical protein
LSLPENWLEMPLLIVGLNAILLTSLVVRPKIVFPYLGTKKLEHFQGPQARQASYQFE